MLQDELSSFGRAAGSHLSTYALPAKGEGFLCSEQETEKYRVVLPNSTTPRDTIKVDQDVGEHRRPFLHGKKPGSGGVVMSVAVAGAVEIQVVYRPVKGRKVTLFASSSPDVLLTIREHLVQEQFERWTELAKTDPVMAEIVKGDTLKISDVLRVGAEQPPPQLRRVK